MPYLIDTHCHLHDKEFFDTDEAEKILAESYRNNVKKIICIGTSHKDSLAARDFAANHDNVFWTYGIHPNEASSLSYPEPIFTGDCESMIAIGEVGLDYHHDGYDRTAQIKLFEQMLQLAADNDLPISFHVREAFDDFFPIVANFSTIRGVVHSFSDNKKNLRRILNETDFYVGVNGMATYSTLPTPPIERILLETDAPFLAPVPYRGEKNKPTYVPDIAWWLSQKLELSPEEVADITTSNASKLFKF